MKEARRSQARDVKIKTLEGQERVCGGGSWNGRVRVQAGTPLFQAGAPLFQAGAPLKLNRVKTGFSHQRLQKGPAWPIS